MLPFETVTEMITWLSGPGLPYVTGIVMSLLASNIKAWASLPSFVKSVTPFVLAVVFAYVFKFLNVPAFVNDINVNFIFNVVIFYLSTQKQYELTIRKRHLYI